MCAEAPVIKASRKNNAQLLNLLMATCACIIAGGLETEKDYPYEATGEKCNIIKKDFRVYVNDSVALSKNETQLAAWLAEHGPISIGINANMMQVSMAAEQMFCPSLDCE